MFQKHGLQGRRKLFYGRGGRELRKVGHHGWPTTKNNKTKHWSKRPKEVSQKMSFGPNYKSFKTSYLEFFFETLFRTNNFFIFVYTFQLTLSDFFLILDFLAESQQKLEKKITHFTIQFHSKNLIYFMNLNLNLNDTEINMLPKHSQKPLSIYEFSSKHVSVWCRKNIFGNNAVPFLDAEEMHS